MVSKEEVIKALEKVKDPEIGASITKLNMIKNIEIIDNSLVKVQVSLTIAGCPLYNVIEEDIKREVMNIKGVKDVIVDFTYMDENERAKLQEEISKDKKAYETVNRTWLEFGKKLPKFNFKKIIAIISNKGGVGKSLVTSLLASELNRRKFKVGILDADLTGSSIAHIFNVEGKRIYANNPIPVESKNGIKIISINLLLESSDLPIMWRGPLLTNALVQLYQDINWGKLDFLLLDMPPGSSDIPLTVFQFFPIDGIIVVTSPQELVKKVVIKSIKMSQQLNVPIIGIIENMSYIVCSNCGEKIRIGNENSVKDFCKKFNLFYLGEIPFDKRISEACDKGSIENYSSNEIKSIVDNVLSKI